MQASKAHTPPVTRRVRGFMGKARQVQIRGGGAGSGKEKAQKHKQFFPVIAWVGGRLSTGWPGVSRPVARGQKFMCCVRNARNINIFVRVPGREDR